MFHHEQAGPLIFVQTARALENFPRSKEQLSFDRESPVSILNHDSVVFHLPPRVGVLRGFRRLCDLPGEEDIERRLMGDISSIGTGKDTSKLRASTNN